jgi:hypothetical protein
MPHQMFVLDDETVREITMHLDLDGLKTNNIYKAFGRQPTPQNGSVEYREFDNRLTVKADVAGRRSIKLVQYYGGAAECFLAKRDSGILLKSSIADVDVRAVLTAMREAMGPQSPIPPNTNPVIIV